MKELRDKSSIRLGSFAPTGPAAEETLYAIVLGEADALVIESEDGPRVYTLRDASEPYRELVERMPGAATVLDAEHTVLYSNGGLERILGRGELSGLDFLDLVTPTQRGLAETLLAAGLEERTAAEMALIAGDGAPAPVRASAGPIAFDGRPCVALVVTALDEIEALRVAAAGLRESERRFQTALLNSPVTVFEQDLDLRYTWIYNPKLGYAADQMIGKTDADIMDPVCALEITAIKRRVLEAGQPSRQEVAAAAPGAPLGYFDLHVEPRLDACGKIIGVACAATDITARKRAEIETKQSQAKLQAAIDSMSDAVFISDGEGNFVEFNDAFATYHRFPSKAEASRFLDDYVQLLDVYEADGTLVPPDQWAVPRALRGESAADWELSLRRRDTGEAWVGSYTFAPIRDDQDRITGSVVTARDVTQRRKDEEALRESKELLATVIERMPVGVGLSDSSGRFVLQNKEISRFVGPTIPSLDDPRHPRWVAYEAGGERMAPSNYPGARALRGDANVSTDMLFRAQDGAEIWTRVSATPLHDKDGAISGAICVIADIDALKRTQEALAAAKAEAERANLGKSKFLAAASHDLRQPVQSLILLSGLLERKVAGDAKLIETIRAIESAVRGLNVLLAGILDISRLDAGVVAHEMQPVDVGSLIEQLSEEYRQRASKKGLRLRARPRAVWASSDPALLQRALRNLVENALNYTREGGVLIGTRIRGERVRIDVVDTGIGVPADQQRQIFEEFYQVGNPGRIPEEGLGLGLAIVSRIAALLGAEVQVASRVGRGSRFSLLLPLDREDVATAAPEPASNGFRGRVLLIEDNAIVRFSVESLLEMWDCEPISAASGEEALDRAAAEDWRFDAIIADYRLGGALTGVAASKEIERRAGRAVPTIVLTGDTAVERISEMDASGYVVLHKPVGAERLRGELERLLCGR